MTKIDSIQTFKDFVAEVKSMEGYKDPLEFGIYKVDGSFNEPKETDYLYLNIGQNYGSAAVFVKALELSGIRVDFEANKCVYDIDEKFIESALDFFFPYLHEAVGTAHKNIQVIKELSSLVKKGAFKKGQYRIIFVY